MSLGELRFHLRFSKGVGAFIVLATVFCLLIGAALTGLVASSLVAADGAGLADLAAALFAGAFFLLIGGALFWSTVRRWRDRPELFVHEGGIRYVSRSRTIEGSWADFDFLRITRRRRRGAPPSDPGFQVAELTTRGDKRETFTVDSGLFTGDVVAAIELIRQGTLEAFLPGYRKMLDRGDDVKVGAVVLRADGLQQGGTKIRWDELRGYAIDRTDVVLSLADGNQRRVTVHGAPNAHVMLALLAERVTPAAAA